MVRTRLVFLDVSEGRAIDAVCSHPFDGELPVYVCRQGPPAPPERRGGQQGPATRHRPFGSKRASNGALYSAQEGSVRFLHAPRAPGFTQAPGVPRNQLRNSGTSVAIQGRL